MNKQPTDEVTTLKQRVHELECLLDDAVIILGSLQQMYNVDLRSWIGRFQDNIPESEEEKAWRAQRTGIICIDGKVMGISPDGSEVITLGEPEEHER